MPSVPLDAAKNLLRPRPLQPATCLALIIHCFLSQPPPLVLCPSPIYMLYLSIIPPSTPILPAVLPSIGSSVLCLPSLCLLHLHPSSLHHLSPHMSPNGPLYRLPFLCMFNLSAVPPSLCPDFLCQTFPIRCSSFPSGRHSSVCCSIVRFFFIRFTLLLFCVVFPVPSLYLFVPPLSFFISPAHIAQYSVCLANATTSPSFITSLDSHQFWPSCSVFAYSWATIQANPPNQHTSSQNPTLLLLPSTAQ